MLNETQKTIMSTTRGDLKRLNLVAVALLRGKANMVELNAMAAMAKPGKTKHLDATTRGILAFQSTLDRFAQLVKHADTDAVLADDRHKVQDTVNPVDACLEATAFDKVTVGKSALINDYSLLQFSRGLFIQMKAKYGDRLTAAATLTSKGSVKVKERTKAEKAKDAFNKLSDAEKAALIASITGLTSDATAEVIQVPAAPAAQTI